MTYTHTPQHTFLFLCFRSNSTLFLESLYGCCWVQFCNCICILHCLEPWLLRLKLDPSIELHVVIKNKTRVLGFFADKRWSWRDLSIASRVVERCNGHSVSFLLSHHTVHHTLVPAVGYNLHSIRKNIFRLNLHLSHFQRNHLRINKQNVPKPFDFRNVALLV